MSEISQPKDVFELMEAMRREGESILVRGRGGEYLYSFETDMSKQDLNDMLDKIPEISLDNGSARVKLIGFQETTRRAHIAVYDKTREHKRPLTGIEGIKPLRDVFIGERNERGVIE